MPHAGDWERAGVPGVAVAWQESAWGELSSGEGAGVWSAVDTGDAGWVIPAVYQRDGEVYLRLFNATGNVSMRAVQLGFRATKAELVELDGRLVESLPVEQGEHGGGIVRLAIPRLGVRTLRFGGVERAGL